MSGMRVLHFIPSLEAVGGSAAQGYMPALLEAMARRAYVRVLALCGGGAPMAGVDGHVSPCRGACAVFSATSWRRSPLTWSMSTHVGALPRMCYSESARGAAYPW